MSLERAKICPVCGAGNGSDAEVCRSCGASLADAAPTGEAPASRGMVKALRIVAFLTYVVFFFDGILSLNDAGLFLLALPRWIVGLALGTLLLGAAEILDLLEKIREKAG